MFDKILDFLKQDLSFLPALKVWQGICAVVAVILIIIIIIALSTSKKKAAAKVAAQSNSVPKDSDTMPAAVEKPTGSQAEVKSDTATETKTEKQTETKAEVKPASVAEVKTETKAEVKPAPVAEVKTETKAEVKSAPVADKKTDMPIEEKPAPKAEVKTEPKAEVKPAPVAEKKVDKPIEEKPAPKAEVKTEPKAAVKPVPKAAVKPAEKSASVDDGDDTDRAAARGKYTIKKQRSGQYVFSLIANNGAVLFESVEYSSVASCRNGIGTFKKYIVPDAFEVTKTDTGDFTYKIRRGNGNYQGRVYESESAARAATQSIQKFYETDIIVLIQKR